MRCPLEVAASGELSVRISPSALPIQTLRIVVIPPSFSRLITARVIVRLVQRFFYAAVWFFIVCHYQFRHLSVSLRIRSLSLQMAKLPCQRADTIARRWEGLRQTANQLRETGRRSTSRSVRRRLAKNCGYSLGRPGVSSSIASTTLSSVDGRPARTLSAPREVLLPAAALRSILVGSDSGGVSLPIFAIFSARVIAMVPSSRSA
jgi:hypothetical protein